MKGVDLRNNKGDNQVMKRQSAGCGDKYPQDEVPEQQADGTYVLTHQASLCVYIYYVNNKVGKYIMSMMM